MNQGSLFGSNFASNSPLAVTDDVSRLLAANCVVAIGVSGGKDSQACALAVDLYLKEIKTLRGEDSDSLRPRSNGMER